ncbi:MULTISPECIES: MmpS family transport accessory protein [Mycobacteroides]|uniref:Uncharacterized protein n=1 Tax=Mycobacteroides immunogenum TaxID=83262 RepID=A0ABR5LM94_9MYCO|nr:MULTISPECIES: MmpS family transport accessory protein [Mycobacteroides]KPG28231.1 hypothetical protein AN912_21985 [Mycobacteroides immunogenum]KPG28856.1 hypothetical protein AN913_13390 [Mycobacteroides immunogenum]KPG60415.1 hypothetical protein AN918_12370 [Mycobacteroides immunogenum]MBF9315224.1 hypothetical protein [Mycobacteroides chelonae]
MISRTTMWIGAVAIMLTMTMPITTPASADPADGPAIYEVVSETIPVADITYFDGTQFQRAEQASLPWTTEVHVGDLAGKGHTTNRAEVRANWPIEPGSRGSVTTRIHYQGKVLIENTRDNGEVGCATRTFSFHWG